MTIFRTWGDLARFTRPEMKMERVSCPIITWKIFAGVTQPLSNPGE